LGVAWVGSLPPMLRDCIPQAADLLVSRLDIETVVVFGRVGSTVDGSMRTLDPKVRPKELIESALKLDEAGGRVSGGGREAKGGFRWVLDGQSADDIQQVRLHIQNAFLTSEAPRAAVPTTGSR
ncbi:hypothetical protein ACFL5O_11835, partial [Myxococcota bacterium]